MPSEGFTTLIGHPVSPLLVAYLQDSFDPTTGLGQWMLPGAPFSVVFLDLAWKDAVDLPWGVLLLIGGGMALSTQITRTGLSAWIGEQMSGLGGLPPFAVLMVVATVLILLTELTSNTATAAAFFPVMGALAVGIGIDPLLMTVVVSMAVLCAFMLPVATPSNAVAFATGELPMKQMVRTGVWMNVLGLVIVAVMTVTLVPLVFGVAL